MEADVAARKGRQGRHLGTRENPFDLHRCNPECRGGARDAPGGRAGAWNHWFFNLFVALEAASRRGTDRARRRERDDHRGLGKTTRLPSSACLADVARSEVR